MTRRLRPTTPGLLRSILLLAIAAFAMAGAAVFVAADRGTFGGAPREERTLLALMFVPYAAVVSGALLGGVAFVLRRLHVQRARWLSDGAWLASTAIVAVTMLLFGPVAGFHHMFRLGIAGYAVVDCEDPGTFGGLFGGCEVRPSTIALGLTVVLWVALVVTPALLVRRRDRR